MSTALFEMENMKGLSLSHGDQMLAVKLSSERVKSMSRGRYNDKRDNHSQPRGWSNVNCYYCHKKGHKRRDCEELTKHLEEKRKEEVQKKSESAIVVDDNLVMIEGDVCFVITDDKVSDV